MSAATRAELLRARRLAERVARGTALLRRKRAALVRALVPLARPAAEARRQIADTAAAAYRAELAALGLHGEPAVAATGWPTRAVEVELAIERLWGVTVPRLSELPVFDRDLAARGTAPAATGPALVEAADRFEQLLGQLLEAVTRETAVRALGDALERTARQLHSLEQRIAPQLAARISTTSRALDERDREDHARLRHLASRPR